MKKTGEIFAGICGIISLLIAGYMVVNEITNYGWFVFIGLLFGFAAR